MFTDWSINEHQQPETNDMTLTFDGDINAAVDEALAWSSMFDHHPTLNELWRDLRHPCSEEVMLQHLEQRPDLMVEAGHVHVVGGMRHPLEHHQRALAAQHLDLTAEVLGILVLLSRHRSCRDGIDRSR